ncbi:SusD/RagB family nutrient-binding outer membrane lipoprotein [Membranihabitans maritimus]|uniref:SusD/RagB family nutrient-binding outer membrane lipoprotein n=1 Tax=Membranihabitans maritimus TaxID=2904244 RepID=UPI001F305AB3|nr:SusD/RagB family nutrient-binding outer membrane lipoprotein [Membranihabitans maritimus]
MIRSKLYIYVFVFLGFLSCDDFLDINESVDTPETTSPNYLLPAIQGNMASTHYEQGETVSYFTRYVTTIFGTSSQKDRWDYRNTLRVGLWRKNYFDVAGNAQKMIEIAREEGADNYTGVGLTMKALSFLTTTDIFGEMPVDDAFTGIYNPTYDDQDMVYEYIGQWLDEGIKHMEMSDEGDRLMDGSADLLYQGNMANWVSFAYGIKARMLLHTANFEGHYEEVLAAVDKAYSHWKDPRYIYSEDPVNDWERNLWGPSRARPQWDFVANYLNNSVSTDFFMNAINLSGELDPRIKKLTSSGENGNYYSIPSSEGLSGLSQNDFADLYNGYWTSDDSPIIYMTEEELNFIEAEAAFYAGDLNRALAAYEQGIRNNFIRLGVTLDSIGMYMDSPAVVQSSDELMVSDIMMQKYIALYLQPETWVDMRRYHYNPDVYTGLEYPENALELYEGKYIQRLPYDPQTEYIYNPNEIERLGAREPLWLVNMVWWAEESTL